MFELAERFVPVALLEFVTDFGDSAVTLSLALAVLLEVGGAYTRRPAWPWPAVPYAGARARTRTTAHAAAARGRVDVGRCACQALAYTAACACAYCLMMVFMLCQAHLVGAILAGGALGRWLVLRAAPRPPAHTKAVHAA